MIVNPPVPLNVPSSVVSFDAISVLLPVSVTGRLETKKYPVGVVICSVALASDSGLDDAPSDPSPATESVAPITDVPPE